MDSPPHDRSGSRKLGKVIVTTAAKAYTMVGLP